MKILLKTCILLLFMISGIACQTKLEHGTLMELNRKGEWGRVKEKSITVIDDKDIYTIAEICEFYFHLIYSEVRLGEKKSAQHHIKELEKYISKNGLPDIVLWIENELDKLKMELQT
ncbi:MAG: hypothetical protein OCD02_08435 [Spirochaetaceae bacterium]